MQSKQWAKAITSIAVALSITAVAGCGAAKTTGNQTANTTAVSLPPAPTYSGPVVATYTGGKLTKQELDQQYNLQVVLPGQASQEPKDKFAQYYIVWYKYVLAKAQAAAKTPPDAKQASKMADQAMTQLAKSPQYGSQAKVEAKMKSLGLTKNDLIRYFADEQMLQTYMQQQVQTATVSTTQAQKYYNQHKSDFVEVTVDQILVSSKSQAQSIEKQLKAGANFAKMADKYSTDPGVKQNHGKYANAIVGQFVPSFAQACRTLPLGQISDPVQSQYGYHILRVDTRKQLTFSEAKGQIDQTLAPQAQQQKEVQVYQDAVKAANVKVTAKTSDL